MCRYIDSSASLGRETNIDLSRYEVCDNVDLDTVLMEYESYYYIKFSRYPKITKKLTQSGKIPNTIKHIPTINLEGGIGDSLIEILI